MKTLLLTKQDVRDLIDMPQVIAAVEEAYRALSARQVVQPDYIGFHLPEDRGEIDFKLSYHRTSEIISVKASSGGFRDNPRLHGVPNGMGTILLFDAQSGRLACVMDGSLITGLRTGAGGAISARLLARQDAQVVGVIGAGNQARMQLRALAHVMTPRQIHVASATTASAQAFKADIEAELGIPVTLAGSVRDAVEVADILITTTRGKAQVVDAAWVRPGTHVIAIGTDQAGKQELDPALFRDALVVVDSVAQCTSKGEAQHAIAAGLLKVEDIHAEIGQILAGDRPGRRDDDQITIFDSTGCAIQDNTTAKGIHDAALKAGVGSFFDFDPTPIKEAQA